MVAALTNTTNARELALSGRDNPLAKKWQKVAGFSTGFLPNQRPLT